MNPLPPKPVRKMEGIPSMLDLVRLSSREIFPPGGAELYRQVALLTEMGEGHEVLVAACGAGITAEYFVREFGVHGSGVDEDPAMVDRAEARARSQGLHGRLQFQHGSMASLPYRDAIFDIVVAELALTARVDPKVAVRELVRVTRPGGAVVLVQLVWKAPVDPTRRDVLSRHLGARPLMLVELKRILREAGVRQLHTEAWSDEATAFRPQVKKPFPDFAELFSLWEKLGILRRAWRRWGWKGVKAAVARDAEVHRLLTRERILGLDMVKGTKTELPASEPSTGDGGDGAGATGSESPDARGPTSPDAPDPGSPDPSTDPSTEGLPLFQGPRGDR